MYGGNSVYGTKVFRDVPPEALVAGIAACGGLDRYYEFCVNQERDRFRAVNSPYGFRANALFPDNANEVIEGAVTGVGRKRLDIVEDFINAGLVTNLPNWWAVPSLRRMRTGEGGTAHRSMIPDSRGERFVLTREGVSWPIFCTWANFSFDIRSLAMGQRLGTPLDVSHTQEATYRVNEAIVDQAVNGLTDDQGTPMTIDGLGAPGLLSSTTTLSYADWTTLTGAEILGIVQDAIELLRITHPGPYRLYVPGNYTKILTSDYGAAYPRTIIERIQQLGPYGTRNLEIRISDSLPNHRVVLVQMDPQSIDVVIGQQPVPVSWQDGPGWNTYWVVLSCVIFRMFSNINGKYGVAVGNLA